MILISGFSPSVLLILHITFESGFIRPMVQSSRFGMQQDQVEKAPGLG